MIMLRHIFHQFACMFDIKKVEMKRFIVIWFACIWTIRKRRIEKIFNTKIEIIDHWMEEVQMTSWILFKCRLTYFNYAINQ